MLCALLITTRASSERARTQCYGTTADHGQQSAALVGLWCARRAFAFAAISVAYPNDEELEVPINLKGPFQLPLPTRSPASRT